MEYDFASMWFMQRCSFCWCEIKSTEAIHVGEETFCSERCRKEFAANPEPTQR